MKARTLLFALMISWNAHLSANEPSDWDEQLWKSATSALADHRPAEAIAPLREIQKKFPGSRHFTESLEALGKAYLIQQQPKLALPALEQARRAWGNSPRSWPPGLLLIQALLDLQRSERAILQAIELQKQVAAHLESTPQARVTFQDALLLEIEGRIRLNQDERAKALLNHPQLERKDLHPEQAARRNWLLLRLHARSCMAQSSLNPGKPASKGRIWPWISKDKQPPRALSESAAFEQLERIGLCAAEAVPLYRDGLWLPAPQTLARATQEMRGILEFWMDRCNLATSPISKMQPDELARYQAELTQEQRRRCRGRVKEILEALAKEQRPPILLQELLNTPGPYLEDLRGFIQRAAEQRLGRLEP
jgi:hypothetical protein